MMDTSSTLVASDRAIDTQNEGHILYTWRQLPTSIVCNMQARTLTLQQITCSQTTELVPSPSGPPSSCSHAILTCSGNCPVCRGAGPSLQPAQSLCADDRSSLRRHRSRRSFRRDWLRRHQLCEELMASSGNFIRFLSWIESFRLIFSRMLCILEHS